ncbi:MAG: rRNA maturation RNase YbeY [Gemmatimonadota bacterium]
MVEAGTGPLIHLNVPGGEVLPSHRMEAAAREVLKLSSTDVEEISMTFLADEEIRELNRRYLGRDYVPDVLTFRLGGEGEPLVGDIYVGLAQAGRQATEAGVSVHEELVRLVVHATLHLIGFDHPEEAEARPDSEHYRLQEEIVARTRSPGTDREER